MTEELFFKPPPKKILWIAGGISENESNVWWACEMMKLMPWPDVQQALVTNSTGFEKFDGFTYHVQDVAGKSLAEKYRGLVLAAHHEGLIDEADIVVCYSYVAAQIVRLLGMERLHWRLRPIVVHFSKVMESKITDLSVGEEDEFWRLVGTGRMSAIYDDNDNEERLVDEALREHCPQSQRETTHRLRMYKYERVARRHDERVVWSGRWNPIKNPNHAAQVMALLSAEGVKTEFYVPSQGGKANIRQEVKAAGSTLHQGRNSDEYKEMAGGAGVVLITSSTESLPGGYLELLERGVVPVFKKARWMETFVGPGWPLVYTKVGEGVEMVLRALSDLPTYRRMLHMRMAQRYSAETNAAEIFLKIWDQYVSTGVEQEFSRTWRSGRIR